MIHALITYLGRRSDSQFLVTIVLFGISKMACQMHFHQSVQAFCERRLPNDERLERTV
jgi:hypothetical protein